MISLEILSLFFLSRNKKFWALSTQNTISGRHNCQSLWDCWVCVCVCVHRCVYVWVWVCMWVRERVREREILNRDESYSCNDDETWVELPKQKKSWTRNFFCLLDVWKKNLNENESFSFEAQTRTRWRQEISHNKLLLERGLGLGLTIPSSPFW